MENAQALAARLREVLLDGTWIAKTNYQDQLTQVDWQQATRPVGSLNTIAALTYHINYYLAGLLEVFAGGDLTIRDKYSFDVPPMQSAADWEQLVQQFIINAERFVQQVAQMSEADLSAPFVKEQYGSYRRNIEGVVEHSYYHLGQVVIIRKLLSAMTE